MNGLCQCGCGNQTNLAPFNDPRRGWVKGQPLRFVLGHNNRKSGVEYIEDQETGCWVWQRGRTTAGYGELWDSAKRRPMYAHRVYYERAKGPIPVGLVVDHLCGNPSCVNPAHLEAVTPAENIRRGRGAKLTHEAVRTIRESDLAGPELAERFGVALRTITHVRSGERWATA